MLDAPRSLSAHPFVHTRSIDEARALYGRLNTPVHVEPTSSSMPFEWRANLVVAGPLTLSSSCYRSGISARSEAAQDNFSIAIPVGRTGGEAVQGQTSVPLVPGGSAFLSSPMLPVHLRLDDNYHALQALIPRATLERALFALTGVPVRAPVRFEPALSLASGAGAAVLRLLAFLVDEVDESGPLLSSPVLLARFTDALLYTLLTGQPHLPRASLDRTPTSNEAPVRRVEEYMAANADKPITLTDLASVGGVSVRSLQLAFRRHRGCSPMAFLRERRIELARARLHDAPAGATVAHVAYECGFEHLGRFSQRYRARFGEAPSETLRRSRRGRE